MNLKEAVKRFSETTAYTGKSVSCRIMNDALSLTHGNWLSRLTTCSPQDTYDWELELLTSSNGVLMRYTDLGEFYLTKDEVHIWIDPLAVEQDVAAMLLSHVLITALELRGVISLHASSIDLNGEAHIFVAPSGVGKSTLAAYGLLSGGRLVSDDIVPIIANNDSALAVPLTDPLKLRPSRHTDEVLKLLHGELLGSDPKKSFIEVMAQRAKVPVPLAAIWLIETADEGESISMLPITGQQAVYRLMEQMFLPRIAESLNFQDCRFSAAVEVVKNVPVNILKIPRQLSSAQSVWDIIQDRFTLPSPMYAQ